MKQSTRFAIFMTTLITLIMIAYSFYWHYVILPTVVGERAKDLNLMQYNAEKDKFVGKDSLFINDWDLYYLQYGNLKGY